MKNYFLIFLLSLFIFGCGEYLSLSPTREMEFIVLNEADTDLEWVKIYAQDQINSSNSGKPIEIASFSDINSGQQSEIILAKIKEFSTTGNGNIYVLALRKGTSDTLQNGIGSYYNYSDLKDEYAPSKWKTREIIVHNFDNKKGEIQINLAYYQNGNYVKSYGR